MDLIALTVSEINGVTISPAVSYGVDVASIVEPISNNGVTSTVVVKIIDNIDSKASGLGNDTWEVTENLAAIVALSDHLFLCDVVERRGETVSYQRVFYADRVVGGFSASGGVTSFYYAEDGDPNLVLYGVSQTVAQIVNQTAVSSTSWDLNGNTVTVLKKLGTLDNFDLIFIVNALTQMRLSTTGLGIGATASFKLDVDSLLNELTAIARFANTKINFKIFASDATPEGAITANRGDLCIMNNGTVGRIYIKLQDSATNTGWQVITSSFMLSPKDFGAKGDGVTDDTTAIQNWLTAISGGAGFITNGTYMCNNLGTIPANTKIFGGGATLKKNGNGTLASLAGSVEIHDLTINGDGGNYTGLGFAITTGNDQKLINVTMLYNESYNLSINKDVGIRFLWDGGMTIRYGAITNCSILLGADGTPQESNGDRVFTNIFTGGTWLIDVQYSQTTIISNCDFVNMFFRSTASKTLVTGNRIATLGNDVTVDGTQCLLDGNIIAGGITIASGAQYNLVTNNVITNGSVITDSSANALNNYDLVKVAYTPTLTATGTAFSLGNGTLSGDYSEDVTGLITLTINGAMGSTTTFGTGSYSWSLPKNAGASRLRVGTAYCNAGGASFYVGAAVVSSSGTNVTVIPHGGGNVWGATIPGTWANGNSYNIQIQYYK